MEHTCLNINT